VGGGWWLQGLVDSSVSLLSLSPSSLSLALSMLCRALFGNQLTGAVPSPPFKQYTNVCLLNYHTTRTPTTSPALSLPELPTASTKASPGWRATKRRSKSRTRSAVSDGHMRRTRSAVSNGHMRRARSTVSNGHMSGASSIVSNGHKTHEPRQCGSVVELGPCCGGCSTAVPLRGCPFARAFVLHCRST
jgi:hypothetical protein